MALPTVRVVTAEIQRDGRYLINQRKASAVLPLLWEFPGGRVREGASDSQALSRSLMIRIGCAGRIGECLMQVEQAYDDYDLVLAVYQVSLENEHPTAGSVAAIEWVAPEHLSKREFPGADQQTIDLLLTEAK